MTRYRKTEWLPDEETKLTALYSYHGSTNNKWDIIGKEMGKTPEACRAHWRLHGTRLSSRLKESPYPRYDKPLEMEGDALILPDPEFPFHHADFINRVLDLSQAWKIKQCIIAGDLLHFDSLSSWEANWTNPNGHGGLDEEQEADFIKFAKGLGKQQQEDAFALLDKIGEKKEDGDPDVSEELRVSRKSIKSLAECFDRVDCLLGNHEGRLLRQLNTPLVPGEITRLIEMQSWRVAPFYYMTLISNGIPYQVEHPKSAAISTAEKLASKYLTNIIMGHSHILRFNWDVSGEFYAITTGCTVDEKRLAYAAQRHTNSVAHALGATIVRDGIPYLLHIRIDWKRMEKMA